MRPYLIASALLSLLALACHQHPAATQRLPSEFENYQPGRYIRLEEFEQGSQEVHAAWLEKAPGLESKLGAFIQRVEPEAVMSLIRVLDDSQTNIFYGSYDAPERALVSGERVASSDGLIGLRVIRQTLVKVSDGTDRLISSIQSYAYDKTAHQISPVFGPDVLRIRTEIEPFRPAENGRRPRGFIGFSWILEGKNHSIETARAAPYISEHSSHETDVHGFFRFPRVTICGVLTHCASCHDHRTKRNAFTRQEIEQPVESMHGYQDFIGHLERDPEISFSERQRVADALKDPRKTFSTENLRRALLEEWKRIRN